MKNAVIAALVAALVSSGASVAATTYISGAKIKPHSIAANRLTPAAVASFKSAGTPAPRALAAAVNSTLDYEETTVDVSTLPTSATASCPAGDVAIGGGYSTSSNVSLAAIPQNGRSTDNTGWTVTMGVGTGFSGDTAQLTVNVSCEPATS